MSEKIEYHDAMITLLELIWGEGFMAPGGTAQVDALVKGLDLRDRKVLDIGCGLGGPDCHLAARHGARVTGIDIEPQLIALAGNRANARGLGERVNFLLVDPGPLPLSGESFDVVVSAGAITQIPDKPALFREIFRVLRPGGAVHNFEWTTSIDGISDELRYFFEMEGLTYALEKPDSYARMLREAGFENVSVTDDTDWYRRDVRKEYEWMKGELYPRMRSLLGQEDADHFVEDWRSMVVVFENGQLTQTICRARKPVV